MFSKPEKSRATAPAFAATPARLADPQLRSLTRMLTAVAFSPRQAGAIQRGCEPWIFSTHAAGVSGPLVLATLQRGRLRATLGVTLTTPMSHEKTFWDGLASFLSKHYITYCWVESMGTASTRAQIPCFPGETQRYTNVRMYVLNTADDNFAAHYSKNHRRNINKARKNGILVRQSREPEAIEIHLRLIGESLSRRSQRGEVTSQRAAQDDIARIVNAGHGQVYQAMMGDEVVSSDLIFEVNDCAFYHSGGSTETGMRLGASYFLMNEIVETLRGRATRSLNLGVANEDAVGLTRFKEGFGASAWEVDTVYFERHSPLALAANAARTLRQDFLRRVFRFSS